MSCKPDPSPEEIVQACRRIRSGEVVITRRSARRWAKVREAERIQAELQTYDLAGQIAEDEVEVPEWFASAARHG